MTLTLGTEFTFGSQSFFAGGNTARVATLTDGRIAVTWQDALVFPFNGFTDVDGSVFTRIFNADGTPDTAPMQVNITESGGQNLPEIAALSDGGYVVSWTNSAPLGVGHNDTDIHAQIFNADGTARLAQELVVSVDDPTPGSTADDNEKGFVQALSGGGFAVIWPTGLDDDVLVRAFDNAGVEQLAETQVFSQALFLSDMTQLSNGDVVMVNDLSATLRLSGPGLIDAPAGIPGAAGPQIIALPTVPNGAIQPFITALPGGGFCPALPGH